MATNESNQLVADPVPRCYQLEALEKAIKQNTVVFFETGTGKTLIAIMLLRNYAHLLRKPSPYVAVFLVPTVVLVPQQGKSVSMLTDLKVGHYYGELGVDFWNASIWQKEIDGHEVLVMTPQVLLNALRHRFIRFDQIKVLIFDECHNARGKHPYACIMMEFYHRERASGTLQLPRVFGMTASPIKAKASSSAGLYWNQISELEKLMHSKVFTCSSDFVIAQYVPSSSPKVKMYNHVDIPLVTEKCLEEKLKNLVKKHRLSLGKLDTVYSEVSFPSKRLSNLFSTFMYCLTELGVWLAMKAAEAYSREADVFLWGRMDISAERIVRAFSLDAFGVFSTSLPSDPHWSICQDLEANMRAGYLTSKVMCLIEILLEYSHINDLRCIIFVERIVTAIVIRCLLNELLPQSYGWRTEYTAGHTSKMKNQSRKEQNAIIDNFRNGTVNIIVSTSMLEEGLDVQSCNLVVRFDLSANICSFIQSRGRARKQNSDFVLMVKSGDSSALARVTDYLAGGEIMRQECVRHYDIPCEPIDTEMHGEPWFEVESTGAIVTLSSSVSLIYFYCARLPSDRYFKPYPRFTMNEDLESCTLHLPNSGAIQTVTERGPSKILKKLVCLAACKQLHKAGALTDNLVPDIVEEEREAQEFGFEHYLDEHDKYFPQELVGSCDNMSKQVYCCYLLELKSDRQYDVSLRDVVLAVHTRLPAELENFNFDFDFDLGKLTIGIKYVGDMTLEAKQVLLCWRFQRTIFRILLDRNLDKFNEEMDRPSKRDGSAVFDYLLLPALQTNQIVSIDWKSVDAITYPKNALWDEYDCAHCFSARGHCDYKQTKSGLVCCCFLEQSFVCTPHNGFLYCIIGPLDGINARTYFEFEDGRNITYKRYYEEKHSIKIQFERENLLNAKRIFGVQNCLQRCRISSRKELRNTSYELPAEVCSVLMSPISASTFYSFSFLPSIMHRIESLLMAANLKSMHMEPNVIIPIFTVLEAITTKKCQENIHLESLETLGDSFLKYAASQHLFKSYQNRHEGLLSAKRKRITCNATLCKLGCDKKIMGFIRNEPFNPKTWIIPGANCTSHILGEEMIMAKKFYLGKKRKVKPKTVADVVEALIGAYLSTGGERAALSFMVWLGIGINFINVPYTRNFSVKPEIHLNIESIQSLLNYRFQDPSLLVEALTHGSYMLPEIPGCYQRLEFLGDAVLDYLITQHLCYKYPGLSPGLITDLRSASVNNECYALTAFKAGLYKHILHASQILHQQIFHAVEKFKESPLASTFGWESEASFPKVLGDVIEALAGAIYVDSGYDKERVFQSMRPLLEPLVTPATLRLNPKRELSELCQKEHYFRKTVVLIENGMVHATVEVEADGVVYKQTCSGRDEDTAKKLANKAVLKLLKENLPRL